MQKEFTNDHEELVSFGLDKIDEAETVEVNLKDLMYVYRTLQEYMRFFHQPSHYKNLEDVSHFLGTAEDKAGFHILNESVYEKMYDMIPDYVSGMACDGVFDNPKLPDYYNEKR